MAKLRQNYGKIWTKLRQKGDKIHTKFKKSNKLKKLQIFTEIDKN